MVNFYWHIMVKKGQSLIFLLIIFFAQISIASDDDIIKVDLHIKDHKFMPDVVELPADKKVNITVYSRIRLRNNNTLKTIRNFCPLMWHRVKFLNYLVPIRMTVQSGVQFRFGDVIFLNEGFLPVCVGNVLT